jgi:hypothetical protein
LRWRRKRRRGRGDPDHRDGRARKVIPDGAVQTARAASRVSRASPACRERLARKDRAAKRVRRAKRGRKGPRVRAARQAPPGQLPSIDQVLPWLHLIFEAWEDYKKTREREAVEREALEEAFRTAEHFDDDGYKKKKKDKHKDKKKNKHKDKHREDEDDRRED